MTQEWGDDKGTKHREEVFIRCIKCGWNGYTFQITQYGATSLCRESCPLCNYDVELDVDEDTTNV